jgi:tetratricopeptide (TPR) repeat protein
VDGCSGELLVSLLRRKPETPVLLAVGFRSGKVAEPLTRGLVAGAAVVIELAPLSESECARLAGQSVNPTQRAAIFSESGGNPFYTLELARAARVPTDRALGKRVADQAGVPPLVAAALLNELHSVSPLGRLLLECASIAGDPFEPELACAIAELSAGAGIEALDELIETGLVHPARLPRRFGFRHPLVRRAVYESTKPGWRLGAHARAAYALGRLGAPATARAHHVEQCASVGDRAAIALLLSAGRESAAGNPDGAIRWFDAALRLIPATDAPTRLEALMGKAEALRSLGKVEACRATLLAATELVPDPHSPLGVGLTAMIALCENLLGRYGQARRRLEGALAELPDRASPEAVTVMNSVVSGAFFTMDLDRMRDTAEAALAAARALGDRGLVATSAALLTHAYTMSGRVPEAEAALTETRRLLDVLTDDELADHLEAADALGWTEFYLERFEDSIRHLTRGLEAARSSRRGALIPSMEVALALSTTMTGDHVEATRRCENAIDAARLTANAYLALDREPGSGDRVQRVTGGMTTAAHGRPMSIVWAIVVVVSMGCGV